MSVKVILIKYGELSTKKQNRSFFINTLYDNIKNKLLDYDVKIHKDRARMIIEFHDKDLESIQKVVDKTFGIHTYHIAYVVPSSDSEIQKELLNLAKELKFSTFKIETKRSDKKFPITSQEYNHVLGGLVLRNTSNVTVDVHNPELKIKVEIREDKTFIYFDSYVNVIWRN